MWWPATLASLCFKRLIRYPNRWRQDHQIWQISPQCSQRLKFRVSANSLPYRYHFIQKNYERDRPPCEPNGSYSQYCSSARFARFAAIKSQKAYIAIHSRTNKRDVQLANLAGPCMVVYNMTNTYPRPPSYVSVHPPASWSEVKLVGSLILAHMLCFAYVLCAKTPSIISVF